VPPRKGLLEKRFWLYLREFLGGVLALVPANLWQELHRSREARYSAAASVAGNRSASMS
jgi:hypothetical protein